MKNEVEERQAYSLTAETPELLPYLPYILQDFWEIGSDPDVMVRLIEKNVSLSGQTRILDLGCGKGAVAVKIADKLCVKVKGVDLMQVFVDYAKVKATEYGVIDLCEFIVEDINETVEKERDYDCVIFGALGSVLGDSAETLDKLKAVIKTGGYILLDESCLPDDGDQEDVRYDYYTYLTQWQWHRLFEEKGLELIETDSGNESDSESGMASLSTRVSELIEKHPDKRDIFKGYIQSQQNEYDDIDNSLITATWILKKL